MTEKTVQIVPPPVRKKIMRVPPPKDLHIVANFSGGRSSALMIIRMIDEGRPPNEIVFCNTGIESKFTYDFIDAFDERVIAPAGIPFHVLEFTADVDYDTWDSKNQRPAATSRERMYRFHSATDNGDNSPFAMFIKSVKHIPDNTVRMCTKSLKVDMNEKFQEANGNADYGDAIGYRSGEYKRIVFWRKNNPDKYATFPLAEAGLDRIDVLKYWSQMNRKWKMSFDMGDGNLQLSNCEGCFFGNLSAKAAVVKTNPKLADFWARMEELSLEIRRKRYPGKYMTTPPYEKIKNQIAWTRRYLNRNPRSAPDPEICGKFFHHNFSWRMLIEYVELFDGDPPILKDIPQYGGCSSGMCHTD